MQRKVELNADFISNPRCGTKIQDSLFFAISNHKQSAER